MLKINENSNPAFPMLRQLKKNGLLLFYYIKTSFDKPNFLDEFINILDQSARFHDCIYT